MRFASACGFTRRAERCGSSGVRYARRMLRSTQTNRGFVPNVLTAACPSRRVLALITNKWVVLVVHALVDGPERFAALRRRIQGVSQKMLTQTLRGMERDGLVSRTVFRTKPPSVEYRLTRAGMSLLTPIEALCAWAEHHVPPDVREDGARAG